MGKNEYLDGDNLEWQERLTRDLVWETPPGFREAEEEEKSLRDLRRIRKSMKSGKNTGSVPDTGLCRSVLWEGGVT